MKIVEIGGGSAVLARRVIAVLNPDSAPIRRVVQDAKEHGLLLDTAQGKKSQSVAVMDTGHIVLSARPLETVLEALRGE